MTTASESAPEHEVGMLLYEGCQTAMTLGLTDLLHIAGRFARLRGVPALRISHWLVGETGVLARSFDTHPDSEGLPDIVVVPGRLTEPASREEAEQYIAWLQERHLAGATLSAICAGVFLLAATGLLRDRPATTHWIFADPFRDAFPEIRLESDRIVVDDGDIITAGGLMAWTDLGIRLVDRLYGPAIMLETARFLLISPAGREQRHYSRFTPKLNHGDEVIKAVQLWLHANDAHGVRAGDIVRKTGLEERTFLRRFKAATGLAPTDYCQRLRVSKARDLLESTKRSVNQIAWSVGYQDAAAFRRLFQRIVGLGPSEYRQRFSSTSVAVERLS